MTERRLALALLVALPIGCVNSSSSGGSGSLTVTPTQLYSGFDGMNSFRIGAVASGAQSVTWSVADPSIADVVANGLEVTLTTKAAGMTTLLASDGAHMVSVPLTVTSYTPMQHMTGRSRYVDGERFGLPGGGMGGGDGGTFMIPDGGFGRGGMFEDRKPCTDCHGIARIEHGPNQAGWMNDDQLKSVFLDGTRPDGSAVYDQDDTFDHHWKVSDPDSLVAYLRSLAARGTPTQQ